MSNAERMNNLPQILKGLEPQFTSIANVHKSVSFQTECAYALQSLKNNDYLASVAFSNQDSLKEAIMNVAQVGLSLSPVDKLAYLVPRKKKVCLDISYQGYIHLAVLRGAVLWAKAVLVYSTDTFKYLGVNQEPVHEFDPFESKRGDLRGGYVLAKSPDGSFLVDFMTLDEILDIRDRSEGWKAHKEKNVSTPWSTDPLEMMKKTLIRRAYKSWPKATNSDQLARALDVSLDADGSRLIEPGPSQIESGHAADQLKQIRDILKELERPEADYVSYLGRINKREIKKLEDLTADEASRSITMLNALVVAQRKKKETPSENAG